MNSRPRKGRTVDDTSAGVEGVAPDFLEQLAPAQAEVAHGTIVHASHDERDRLVAFGERKERQPAQPTQNVGLGWANLTPAPPWDSRLSHEERQHH